MAAQTEELESGGSVVNLEVRRSPAERLKSVTALKSKKAARPVEEDDDPDRVERFDEDEDDEFEGDDVPVRASKRSIAQLPQPQTGFRFTIGNISFLLMVALPVLVTTIYMIFIATPQYVSQFKFSVREQEQAPLTASGPGASPGNAAALTMMSDNFIIIDYLQSRDALEELAKSVNFDEIYRTDKADWLNRLSENATIEQKVAYWKWRISSSYDMSTGIATVEVKAFTPEQAQKVAAILLASAERLINTMQDRARHDAVGFFEDQVKTAEARLIATRAAVRTYRNEQQIVSPTTTGEGIFAVINKMEQDRASLQSQLSSMQSFMNNDAPSVKVMQSQLSAVDAQISDLRNKVGSKTGRDAGRLSGIIASFEELDQNRVFAEKLYDSAVNSFEMARANAAMKHTYMATYITPKVAETAAYPKRLKDIFLVSLAALFVWFVSLMGIYAVRDHAL